MAGVRTSRDSLHQRGQELIEELNAKRKQDTQIMQDFRNRLETNAHKTCSKVEEALFGMYDVQGEKITAKMKEYYATLDRISKLQEELHDFKKALGMLYQDMQPNS